MQKLYLMHTYICISTK